MPLHMRNEFFRRHYVLPYLSAVLNDRKACGGCDLLIELMRIVWLLTTGLTIEGVIVVPTKGECPMRKRARQSCSLDKEDISVSSSTRAEGFEPVRQSYGPDSTGSLPESEPSVLRQLLALTHPEFGRSVLLS